MKGKKIDGRRQCSARSQLWFHLQPHCNIRSRIYNTAGNCWPADTPAIISVVVVFAFRPAADAFSFQDTTEPEVSSSPARGPSIQYEAGEGP